MSKFTCLVLCAVAVSCVYAVTEEEKNAFREAIKPIIAECSKAHGVNDDIIKEVKQTENADGINPCFLGCVLKKTNVLNEQGQFEAANGLNKIKQYVKNKDDIAKFEEVGQKCASVNDQAVSDGTAGCERAKLLLSCFFEHKAEVPL